MTSYYSQIQYVPDPHTGERINIGLVAIDAHGSAFRFVSDWRRAASFGGEDVSFLREFAKEASDEGATWFRINESVPPEQLGKRLGRWHNKIQFTAPRPSVKARDALLESMSLLMLHIGGAEVQHVVQVSRGREKVVSSASRAIGAAMRKRFGRAPRGLIHRDLQLDGAIEKHRLDIGLKNGELYGGSFALSFEAGSPKSQQRETDAIAFALTDLRDVVEPGMFAIAVIPPRAAHSPTYDRARHIFKELKAPMVSESRLAKWATDLVDQLPENVAAHG